MSKIFVINLFSISGPWNNTKIYLDFVEIYIRLMIKNLY